MNKMKFLIMGIWLILNVVFLVTIQRNYMEVSKGIVLLLFQIGLFWILFSYKKHLLNKEESITKKSIIHLNIFALITIFIIYYNLLLLWLFSYNQSITPILKNMEIRSIGPFVHYQIIVSLVICFIFLYVLILKYNNGFIQINAIFLFVSSNIILIVLHSRLSILDSITNLNNFVSNQMIIYTMIILIFGGGRIFISKQIKEY